MPRKKSEPVVETVVEEEEAPVEDWDNLNEIREVEDSEQLGNPFAEGVVPMAMPIEPIRDWRAEREEFERKVGERLNQPVPREYVRQRQIGGGKIADYIDGQTAIRLANDIFGWQNWTSYVKEVKFFPFPNDPEGKGMWYAIVGVNVGGTYHEGVGRCGMNPRQPIADAHDMAVSGAETDALKRALRNFGEGLGLSCYPDVTAEAPAPQVVAQPQAPRSAPQTTVTYAPQPIAAGAKSIPCEYPSCTGVVETWAGYTGSLEQLVAKRRNDYGAAICGRCVSDIKNGRKAPLK